MNNSRVRPEVAFDRYVRAHSPYAGRQDLDRLTQQGFGSLLSVIQRAFNEALENEKDVPEHVDHFPIHFDYIESPHPNAHALRDEEYSYSYIGVTMGLVYQLGDVSVALSRSDAVTDLLNIHLTPEVRDGLQAMLFQTLWGFVAGHEYAHIVHGHVNERREKSISFNEITDEGEIGDLEQQTMELDADGYGGVYHGLSNFFREEVRHNGLSWLQVTDRSPESQDEVLFSCFVLAVGGFLFARPPVDVNNNNVYKLTHPPQLARLNYVMEGAISWCRQNRPALAVWMTPDRFRMLIRPGAEAIWDLDGGLRWQEQIAFLESTAGKEYVRRLGEDLKRYVAAL
jgi:hypothetical protein